jgi:hypothetical protein
MARLAIAAAGLAGLLVLPATALAREPSSYRGTLVIDQRPLPGAVPAGSSMSYRFHARYAVTGRRQEPFGVKRGGEYSLAGQGNQTLAYKADLHRADTGDTFAHLADWHGEGRWTKHSGQVAVLNIFGRRLSLIVDLNLPPKTIPLSVSSEETDVGTTENGTCVFRGGLSGSTISVNDPCSDRFQSVSIPKGTAVNPYSLLSEGDPRVRDCRGPRVQVRIFNGFCSVAKRSGRIHATHKNVWLHSVDYPFIPWRDQDAAFDAQEAAGLFYGPFLWGEFALRTTYVLDLRPARG